MGLTPCHRSIAAFPRGVVSLVTFSRSGSALDQFVDIIITECPYALAESWHRASLAMARRLSSGVFDLDQIF
jgi:hypothetical protein